MSIRNGLEKKIENKRLEIQELEAKLREANAFLQGMQEALKMLPREISVTGAQQVLRPGSDMAKTRDFLAKIVRPAHISEILDALNVDGVERQRTSVSSSLASYARKGEIFKRTGPNTFALIGLDLSTVETAPDADDKEPPNDFGDDTGNKEESHTVAVLDEDIPF